MSNTTMNRYILLFVFALVSLCCRAQSPEILKLISFNIRYDNPDDGINAWQNRKEKVVDFLTNESPDILCLQEVLTHQNEYLKDMLPDFASYGVGRDDGKEAGEFCPIFYRTERFERLSEGYKWLSETRDKPSLGWDAACNRMVVWVVLKDKVTGEAFAVMNTHLDHQGEVARKNGAEMLLQLADSLSVKDNKYRVALAGDFNAEPKSKLILDFTGFDNTPPSMRDTYFYNELDWSYHDFGRLPMSERKVIDYIFVLGRLNVESIGFYKETEESNHVYLSDHCPLIWEFRLR